MSSHAKLILLLVAIFLVSTAYSFAHRVQPFADARAYDRIGWNLAEGHGYVETLGDADDAIVRVGPGYQFFLAGVYKMFGHSFEAVWVLHAILRTITAAIIFYLAQFLFRHERLSLAATALFGFSPDFVLVNGLLLTETLTLTLLVGAVYLSLWSLRTSDVRGTFYTSLLWGLAALVRPTVLLAFLVFVAAWLVLRAYRHALVALIFPVILLGGWSLHNSLLYRTPLFTTTAGAYDLWVGNNPDARGGFEKTPEIQAVRDATHSVPLSKVALRKYVEFATGEPLQFLELQIRKTAIYFSLLRPTGFWPFLNAQPAQQAATVVLSTIWSAAVLVFGLAGLASLWTRYRDRVTRVFVLMTAALPFGVIPIIVEGRYRYTFLALLTIAAAYAIVHTSRRALGGAVIALVGATGYDVTSNAGEFLDKL